MTYLAMDIGASSGKLVKARLEDGRIVTQVVHRFENTQRIIDGHLCWDIEMLYREMVTGLRKAGGADYITIDTWAVDYVLLDAEDRLLTPAVAYRDGRTDQVACPVSREELYRRTGIQHQKFNTVYQLLAQKAEDPDILEKAHTLLFIPDYLAFRLTGVKVQEYTNASTSGLLKAGRREWDRDLIDGLGLPQRLFGDLSMPGTVLGPVREDIGYDATFILAPTHDTASAVLASPLGATSLFLSSGTWSLLGCISDRAYTDDGARLANLTNEGADDGRIRLLKNIMGTWMLQSIRREAGDDVSFDDMVAMARKSPLAGLVDPMNDRFLAPHSMTREVSDAIAEQGLPRPEGLGEVANVVYHSLADAYARSIRQLEDITGRRFTHLAIVGGGSRDGYLNTLAGRYTGLEITTGPQEGSATGALLSAMMHTGLIRREDIVRILTSSFDIGHITQEEDNVQ